MSLTGSSAPERASLWLIGSAALATLLLSQIPLVGMALYPLKLLVTFLHEASHGLAAILTGGRLDRFVIHPDASGLAYTEGGFRPFVLAAGYLGSCLWGGVLLVASRRRGWEHGVLYALSAFLAIFTLLFVRNVFGFAMGLALAAFFGWLPGRVRGVQLSWLLAFIAVQNSFYAVADLFNLIALASHTGVLTDAQLMSAELTYGLVPPIVFALAIALAALAIFAVFLRLALRGDRPRSAP